jgi:hypothetical protein
MKYVLFALNGLVLLLGGSALAQPCEATPSVLLTYITQSECITVCEGSQTTVQVRRDVGTFSPCDVILSTLVTVFPEQFCTSCGESSFGYATLDPLAWTLDDGNTTFTNTIHGQIRGCVRVTWDAILSPGPIVHIDPANGFPQSMCVFVQFAPYAQPCFGPFASSEIPVIVELPGCNSTTPCNSSEGSPPDLYSSSLLFFPGVGIYLWSATILGDNGGNVCVTMDRLLPVEFGGFDAVAGDHEVTLNWSMRSEQDNARFDVERDGQVVAQVPSLGNSSSGHHYTWIDRTVSNGRSYSYTLFAADVNGNRTLLATQSATPRGAVITEYALTGNYPNPFNPTTTFGYSLKDAGHVTLNVYDLTGRLVSELVNTNQPLGSYNVTFNGTNLPSGIYYYRLNVNGFSATQKMVLMK